MTGSEPTTRTGQNFAVTDLGLFSELRRFTFETAEVPRKFEGKVFLKEILNLTGCEISLNNLPPDTSIPFYHKHRSNEEIYLFVRGVGEFQVDERVFGVSEGTIVRVDPDGERCPRNTSKTEDLCWLVVQARADSFPEHTIQDGFGIGKRVSWSDKERI